MKNIGKLTTIVFGVLFNVANVFSQTGGGLGLSYSLNKTQADSLKPVVINYIHESAADSLKKISGTIELTMFKIDGGYEYSTLCVAHGLSSTRFTSVMEYLKDSFYNMPFNGKRTFLRQFYHEKSDTLTREEKEKLGRIIGLDTLNVYSAPTEDNYLTLGYGNH